MCKLRRNKCVSHWFYWEDTDNHRWILLVNPSFWASIKRATGATGAERERQGAEQPRRGAHITVQRKHLLLQDWALKAGRRRSSINLWVTRSCIRRLIYTQFKVRETLEVEGEALRTCWAAFSFPTFSNEKHLNTVESEQVVYFNVLANKSYIFPAFVRIKVHVLLLCC